jgi:SOS response regulatory protein OraA/RecX
VDSIQTYRDTIGGLETDVETSEGLTQFAQQAYDYVNGQLDAETSLEDIVEDLVENGYSEAGANALVENIDGMRTNLSAAEDSLGTANANQLFGQTAYSFVNEQLELIANQDPDAEVQLSENDIIAKLVENGFSEDNAATLVGNVSTIRTTETTLRDQIDGLEAENTFAEGAYDFVNTRLDAMLGQDPNAEVQITPESIVNELVENGFDQTTAESLVSNVTTVKDKVADLGMQLDTLGTEASFAQRAYSYVNSMFDQGKTAEEISSSLVEKGFAEDTASTLVTSVNDTRSTLSGLETDLGTAQDQRSFAQRAFDFVNSQLDGEVSTDDIRQDLLDNGFSELDADALITDATDIRSNTSLLEANNSFAQGAYGFIQEQLDAGSQTTDIIQEMIDNGFGYDKAQSMVTNVVNVRNEVDTLSDALGIMEGRAEFAQTSFDYINTQLDNNVTEDALLNDLVENYGFTADNAQNFVDTVQDTRFRQSELDRIKTATTTGTTFDFGGRMVGPDDEEEEAVVPANVDGPFAPITRPDPTTTTTPATAVGGVGGVDGGGDDGTYVGGQPVELDEFGNPILRFDAFDRPLGTYLTQPTAPVGPFDAYAMQMPETPAFNPQQARLGPQPTQVTLDEAGFITEPVSYIPEQVPTDPTPYYSPQFNQFTEVPVGYGATTVPLSFIQQQQPAINAVTQEGIGAFLGRKPPVGVT